MKTIKVLLVACTFIVSAATFVQAEDGAKIVHRISENISRTPAIGGYNVEFKARLGEVVASGVAESELTKQKILNIAANTEGVHNIKDEISVSPTDARLNRASASANASILSIEQKIRQDPELAGYAIHVGISDNIAVLSGDVDTEAQKQRIARIAGEEAGVVSVNNFLQVRGPMADRELEQNVLAALERNEEVNADKITVQANRGTVILKGSLPDFKDIDRALATTLMVKGVEDLQSELTINGKPYRSAWPKQVG